MLTVRTSKGVDLEKSRPVEFHRHAFGENLFSHRDVAFHAAIYA
jgi:hypothetical protein